MTFKIPCHNSSQPTQPCKSYLAHGAHSNINSHTIGQATLVMTETQLSLCAPKPDFRNFFFSVDMVGTSLAHNGTAMVKLRFQPPENGGNLEGA